MIIEILFSTLNICKKKGQNRSKHILFNFKTINQSEFPDYVSGLSKLFLNGRAHAVLMAQMY